MLVDLRSDTVTKPTPAMLEAMFQAQIGDDVFNEDPTVVELEKKVAAIFGKEAALFCPSGTMTNQIAIKILSASGQEIICDHSSHVYLYEGGGLAFNSGLSTNLLIGDRGRLHASQVEEAIKPDHVYYPKTALVSLENTHNRGAGSVYKLDEIKAIRKVCLSHNLKTHLDGARIFNALAESDYNAVDIGSQFDTISVCLSKGLGAPVGSVLVASAPLIHEGRRVRKVLGGGMRQAGFLAAAGIYALNHNVSTLKDDHSRAKKLFDCMSSLDFIDQVFPVETNIIVSKLNNNFPVQSFIDKLAEKNIKVVQFGKQAVRMVTHLDFTDEMLDYVCQILPKIRLN
ncbi:MAG: aminotransferase class I/II-fold pyridoxal phosphate-dependent enzyme [Bacteroidetes bacterium]|nr:aminotransferase class I/II-fold pyridoxal phosphate-dependent enzyme [Bacteroidota bacterium]